MSDKWIVLSEHVDWLVISQLLSGVISQVLVTSEQPKKKRNSFCRYIVTNNLVFVPPVIQLVSVSVKVEGIYLHFGE